MSVFDQFNDDVAVYRKSEGDFGRGESIFAFASGLKGLVQTIGGSESKEYQAIGETATHVVFTSTNLNTIKGDWVRVVSASTGETIWMRAIDSDIDASPSGDLRLYMVVGTELNAAGIPEVGT
jgi:hypothetical protein